MNEDQRLLAELKEAICGLSHIKHPFAYESLSSTNDFALLFAKSGADSGTIIMTSRQFCGRGRLERSWYAGEGDIIMSIILNQPFLPKEWWLLPMIPAVAIVRALLKLGVNAKLKWPNDIVVEKLAHEGAVLGFADMRKLGGILIENIFCKGLSSSIIGIGINIKRREELQEVVAHAGFLASYLPKIERKSVLRKILCEFDELISHLDRPDFSSTLVKAYEENCATIGRKVILCTKEGGITAWAKGLGKEGSLVVNDGIKDHLIFAGDVGFVIDH